MFDHKPLVKRRPVVAASKERLTISNVLGGHAERRVPVNGPKPTPFRSAHFEGHVLFKVRTGEDGEPYGEYFEGKKRVFEVQVQGHFRNLAPDDQVFVGLEIPGHVPMGRFVRVLLALVSASIQRLCPGVMLSTGSDDPSGEDAHIMFPLGCLVDRLVVTPPGVQPPAMGVHEFPETLTKAERARVTSFDLTSTYSFSLHGMYSDFHHWRLCNMPGVGDTSLRYFWGDRAVRLVAYALPRDHRGPHSRLHKRYLLNFELQNAAA